MIPTFTNETGPIEQKRCRFACLLTKDGVYYPITFNYSSHKCRGKKIEKKDGGKGEGKEILGIEGEQG